MKTRFFTSTNHEVPALTTAQMREVDRIAMHETGPNLFQMMENAGRSLAEMTLESLGEDWQQTRVVVLAGTGGNGGGGITAARHLANRGVRVELCMAMPVDPTQLSARPLDEIKPGGLGLHFIRESMDVVSYMRADNANRLRLVKLFP